MIRPLKSCFEIRGGAPICGTVALSGNKNAVLPMIAATLLTEEPVTLTHVPDILDVRNMLALAESIGVTVTRSADSVTLCAANLYTDELSRERCTVIRTSMLFAAPLLARRGHVSFYPPGGDVIGRRRLDTHFYGLIKLGATLESDTLPFTFSLTGRFTGRDLFLDEASVTATEHIMTAAVLADGITTIYNAACEPHIQDLGELLNKMGANISGLGSNTLIIEGVESLSGAEHAISSDHIEGGSFLALAAATGGSITLTGTRPRYYWMMRRVFERFNIQMEISANEIHIPGGQKLEIRPDIGNAIPVIADGPWPQYPSDMMACTIVMATQATGTVLFFEKMFESRIYFVDRLISMGANAIVCDPHRVVISGPARLRPANITSPDIRAGMAMVIAALCAEGKSIISGAEMIDRGYENLILKLSSLGCDITRISD